MTEHCDGMRFIFSYCLHLIFHFDIVTGIDLNDTSGAQEAIRTRQCNFVAFVSRLTQSGLADRSHFSIPDFRAALEEEPDQRSRAYRKQGPQLDVYVPLAGIWIQLCGNVIFAHCRNAGTLGYRKEVEGRERVFNRRVEILEEEIWRDQGP